MLFISFGRPVKRAWRALKGVPPEKMQRVHQFRTAQWGRLFREFEATPDGVRLRADLDSIKEWDKKANETQIEYLKKFLRFAKQNGAYRTTQVEIRKALRWFIDDGGKREL
ncbi:MAG: hypothetical protein NTW59_04310 [Candidatus Diapherotrites archaeon]|nr:hypothetical protein [Candidatus Diapherotrites archaeon]